MQEPVTYTFVDEDGVTVLGSVTYDYAQIVAGLYNWDVVKPVKEGYEFAGWCVEGTDYVDDLPSWLLLSTTRPSSRSGTRRRPPSRARHLHLRR